MAPLWFPGAGRAQSNGPWYAGPPSHGSRWRCRNCGQINAAEEKTCTTCDADNPNGSAHFPFLLVIAAAVLFVLGLVGIVTAEELGLVP